MEMTRWEIERTELLIKQWNFRTAGQIAKDFGTTRSAICGKIARLRQAGVLSPGITKHLDVAPNRHHHTRPHKPKPPPMPPKPQPPPKPIVAPGEAPCTLLELNGHTCRWPLWINPGDPVEFYCGATPLDGSPYCTFHTRRGFTTSQGAPHARN